MRQWADSKNPLNVFALDIRQGGKAPGYRGRRDDRRIDPERGAACQNHRALDGVAQFAYVAGP